MDPAVPGVSRRMSRRTLLAGAAAVPAGAALLAGTSWAGPADRTRRHPRDWPPTVLGAEPDQSLTDLFDAYSDSGVGWTGADSTYSVKLPDGRIVWIFSDTFLGPVNADGSRPSTTPFINNSFVVQDGTTLSTVHGGTAAAPAALVEPAEGWYWAGAGNYGGGTLNVTYNQFVSTGSGAFAFAWKASALARFDPSTLAPIDVTDLPSAVSNLEGASWLLAAGGYTYIYRVEDLGDTKYLHVARVSGTDLRASWQFWTGSGWSSDQTASARVMSGVSNEYSVTPLGSGYVLVTQDTTETLSAHVVAYFGTSPTGPFTDKTLLYTTPETGAAGSYGNANVYTYNPHVHPELSTADTLVVSYNVNSFDSADLYADVSIYRPRFVQVSFGNVARGR
jgi:hypothetical protein